MEEAAFVLGKAVRGVAGLVYLFGDVLIGLGPDGATKVAERRRLRKPRKRL
ncbi:hypothetical protein ACM614_22080 [Streptomyces sp. 12297]